MTGYTLRRSAMKTFWCYSLPFLPLPRYSRCFGWHPTPCKNPGIFSALSCSSCQAIPCGTTMCGRGPMARYPISDQYLACSDPLSCILDHFLVLHSICLFADAMAAQAGCMVHYYHRPYDSHPYHLAAELHLVQFFRTYRYPVGLIISYVAFSISFNAVIFAGLLTAFLSPWRKSAFLDGQNIAIS